MKTKLMFAGRKRSYLALNLTNFFLSEVGTVIIPFLSVFLKRLGWRYDQIGLAFAVAGVSSFLFQIPAGIICDKFKKRRALLAMTTVLLGVCYTLIPAIAGSIWKMCLDLFVAGLAGVFFAPLLASLAVELSHHGKGKLERTLGGNQGWNHAGNLTAGVLALTVVGWGGIRPLFATAAVMAVIAAICCLLIRPKDLDCSRVNDESSSATFFQHVKKLFSEPGVPALLISITLFHVANAPLQALVSLYMKASGGTDTRVAMLTIASQPLAIVVTLLIGKFSSQIGRKTLFAAAFLLLPVRILLYLSTHDPVWLIAITALDGLISGTLLMVLILICQDLTKRTGGFNFLMALTSMAPAVGAVIGSSIQGYVTEYFGFPRAFLTLAVIAIAGAFICLSQMLRWRPAAASASALESAVAR